MLEIGPAIAQSVFDYFNSKIGTEIVAELANLGLNFGSPVAKKAAGRLAGKTIVVDRHASEILATKSRS